MLEILIALGVAGAIALTVILVMRRARRSTAVEAERDSGLGTFRTETYTEVTVEPAVDTLAPAPSADAAPAKPKRTYTRKPKAPAEGSSEATTPAVKKARAKKVETVIAPISGTGTPTKALTEALAPVEPAKKTRTKKTT